MRFKLFSRFRHFGLLVVGCCLVVVSSQAEAARPTVYSDQASNQSSDQYYEQGVEALRQEQWKSAAISFEQTLELDPRRADAANGLGVALGKVGDPQGSQAAFRRAIEIDPSFAEAHYNLGLWLRAAGDFDQSVAELKTAIQLRADYEAAQLALGQILQQLGEPDQAVELFQAVIREDPRSAEAHNWLGVAYAQKNHLLDSIGQFQQAVDLNPEYVEAYNNLGSTLARAQRMDDAIRVFRTGLALEPKNLALRLNLAEALRAKGNRDEALQELRSLLKDGDNAQVESAIAEILREKRDFPGAIDAAEKALKIDPGLDSAYETLGGALKAQAMAMPSRPARHSPNAESKARYDAGSQLLARGDPQAAEKELQKAVEADPDYAEAHNLLGFALWPIQQPAGGAGAVP